MEHTLHRDVQDDQQGEGEVEDVLFMDAVIYGVEAVGEQYHQPDDARFNQRLDVLAMGVVVVLEQVAVVLLKGVQFQVIKGVARASAPGL